MNARVLLNSALAFACAVYLVVTLHELAHGMAGRLLGLQATVYPNHVDYSAAVPAQLTVTALVGPLFSLVSGLVLLAVRSRGRGFGSLLVLWSALVSVQTFSGYLMTGPFVTSGDIGAALNLMQAPALVRWLGFVLGAAGTVWLGFVATRRFLALTDPAKNSVAPQLRQVGLFAWLLGVVLAALGGTIVDQVSTIGLFELMGVLSSGLFVLLVRFFWRQGPELQGRGLLLGPPWVGAGLFLLLALFRLLVLRPGWTLP